MLNEVKHLGNECDQWQKGRTDATEFSRVQLHHGAPDFA